MAPATGDRIGVVWGAEVCPAFVIDVGSTLLAFELEGSTTRMMDALDGEGRTWCRWDAMDALRTAVALSR